MLDTIGEDVTVLTAKAPQILSMVLKPYLIALTHKNATDNQNAIVQPAQKAFINTSELHTDHRFVKSRIA